jgi:hypothetical protein
VVSVAVVKADGRGMLAVMRGVLLSMMTAGLLVGCVFVLFFIAVVAARSAGWSFDPVIEVHDLIEEPEEEAPCPECEAGWNILDTWVDCLEHGSTRSPDEPDVAAHLFFIDEPWLEDGDDTVQIKVECLAVPVVLGVSSCEPVTWLITRYPSSVIERVIVSGHEDQTITGIPGVPIERGVDCCYDDLFREPYDVDCYEELVRIVESAGAEVVAVDHCALANLFHLRHYCR